MMTSSGHCRNGLGDNPLYHHARTWPGGSGVERVERSEREDNEHEKVGH